MMVFTRPTAGRSRLTQGLFLSLIASILVLGVTATPAFAFAGDLDPTFDTDGKVTTAVPGLTAVRGTAVLPDGRIVVVGTSGPNTTSDFEVAIFLPNGAPDPSFGGGDGKAAFDAGGDDDAEAVAVNEEDNGSGVLVPRIYVAGKSGAEAVVMRIIPETSEKDPSFGTGGVATTVGLIGGVARDVLVQPDDSVLIAGGTTSGATRRDFLLARFTPSGTLDNTWNLTGMVITNNPVNTFDDEAWGVTLQFTDATNTSFKVVAGGQTDNRALGATSPNLNVAVARYSSSGVPDTTFGTNGWAESFDTADSEDGAFDVKVQPAPDGTPPGAIVAAGYTRATPASLAKFFVVRFNDVGGHDTTFNGTGKQTIDVPAVQGSGDGARQSFAQALAVQPNRKLVLAGASRQSSVLGAYEYAVVRLTPDGARDTETFSGDGIVTTSMSGADDFAYDAVLQPDGKIVVAGESGSPKEIGVARYFGDPVAYLSGPAPATEGESGTKNFIFTITTTAASSKVFDLVFKTSDGPPPNGAQGCAADVTATSCDYTTVSTTVRFLSGETSKTVSVPVRGDTVAEPDETFDGALSTITASDPATIFPARSTAPATIVNDDAASVGINDVQQDEGVSGTVRDFTFTVTQSVVTPGVTTTVEFQTADGTATTADDDYEGRSGSVQIPAGASSAPVTVTVNGDDKVEPSEDFFVNLTRVSCSQPGCLSPSLTAPHSDTQGKGTILDDDDKAAKVSIGDYSAPEGDGPNPPEGPGTTFNFVVTKTGTTTENVTVTFATDDFCETQRCIGDENVSATVAQEDVDYQGRSGELVFPPGGPSTQIVTVTVFGDISPEFDEPFRVTISVQGASVEDGEGIGTIQDDDGGGGTPGGGTGGEVFTESLGGILVGGPDSASWAEDRLDVFVIGGDNAMWRTSWTGDSWTGWGSLGGGFTSDPSAVSWDTGRIDVFGRGGDNALWHAAFSNGAWTGWESLGGILTSAPDVASWGPGRLDVFGRGGDNALWRKTWNGTSWSAWESLGGIITSDPSAVSWGPDRIDVFARGGDNALWQKSWDGSSWTGWGSLGGQLIGGPDASSLGEGSLDVFVIGTDKAVWQNFWDGDGWSGWGSWGGIYTSDPSAVSWGPDRIDVFGRGGDNALWHKWVDGGP